MSNKDIAIQAIATYLHEEILSIHGDESCYEHGRQWKPEAICMQDAQAVLELPEVQAWIEAECLQELDRYKRTHAYTETRDSIGKKVQG